MLVFKLIITAIQILAIIAGIYYWKYYSKTNQKYFLFLIIFAVLVDLFSGFISNYTGKRFNLLFNILTITSFLFYLFWFYFLFKNKKTIYVFTLVFVFTMFYSFFNYNIIYQLYRALLLVGTVIILMCSILYFMTIIKTDMVIKYKQSQKFWIVTGLLVFYIGFLPLFLLLPIIKGDALQYKIPITILNILLYGCFIISFKVAKYNYNG